MAAIIADAGPLFSLINRADRYHEWSKHQALTLPKPFITTDAALTEAMYFAGKLAGYSGQKPLWKLISSGILEVSSLANKERERMHLLMDQYADAPMDYADASLVAVSEQLNLTQIVTLDYSHFRTYRMHGKIPFDVISPQ